jgi:hypothetical protein
MGIERTEVKQGVEPGALCMGRGPAACLLSYKAIELPWEGGRARSPVRAPHRAGGGVARPDGLGLGV